MFLGALLWRLIVPERIVEEQQPWNVEHLLLPHTLGRAYYFLPETLQPAADKHYANNADFWKDALNDRVIAERIITLPGFNVFEWIPRNPGLYHKPESEWARAAAQEFVREMGSLEHGFGVASVAIPPDHAAQFRKITGARGAARELIYTPQGKVSMLQGGIGCVRLSQVELKNGDLRWFMCASSSDAPDEGIPLLMSNDIYNTVIDDIRESGSAPRTVIGKTKYIQQNFSDLYSKAYGIPRVYLEVLDTVRVDKRPEEGEVSVAASFLSDYEGYQKIYASYVTFNPGLEGARQNAARWLREEYVEGLYRGSVLTDFDQQSPTIGNSLFSLDQVLSSPDLAKQIGVLKNLYGHFDWTMLETSTLSFSIYEENTMVKNIVKGDNARINVATGNATISTTEIQQSSMDLDKLAAELNRLRLALNKLPDDAERDEIKGSVAKAETAATKRDHSGLTSALSSLKPFADKVLSVAKEIGVGVAVEAIKSAVGL
jgi:hypothetical protein